MEIHKRDLRMELEEKERKHFLKAKSTTFEGGWGGSREGAQSSVGSGRALRGQRGALSA